MEAILFIAVINLEAYANPNVSPVKTAEASPLAPAVPTFFNKVETAFEQAAAEHPGHAAMAKLGVGMMAVAAAGAMGAVAAFTELAPTAAAATLFALPANDPQVDPAQVPVRPQRKSAAGMGGL